MLISRRGLIAGAALGLSGAVRVEAVPSTGQRALPRDFLWGTAISAYQSECNNSNTDSWLLENIKPTVFSERSGDACDSYHRYAADF